MAAQRYEISLRVLKHILRVSAANKYNTFQHEKRNYLSPSSHVIWNTIEITNHFTLIFFCCKRCNLLWSHSNSDLFHMKITSYFHTWWYHVFMQKLTWYFKSERSCATNFIKIQRVGTATKLSETWNITTEIVQRRYKWHGKYKMKYGWTFKVHFCCL